MCRKIIWAIAFLPTSSAAKLGKKRKRKESCSEMRQGELVHMENKSHCKTAVGNDFSCCGICPPILSNYILMWIHLFMYFTPSGMGQCHCHHACPACARCREANTVLLSGAACHIHPSSPAFPCLSLCYMECTAISGSDFCFLVFAFSFIYYSFFLLVLDVCKYSCFELWREHWVWNAWWWWHLGFFMLMFAWAIFLYECGIYEPGREDWDLWTKLHCCHGCSSKNQSWKVFLTCSVPGSLPSQAGSTSEMLRKNEAWIFLDGEEFLYTFCKVSVLKGPL